MTKRKVSQRVLDKDLENAKYYDQVSGLPNRVFFMENLEQTIHRAQRLSNQLALLFIDIDKFHEVNSTYGNDVGDKVLKKFASLVKRVSRKMDYVAKVGDDEFTVLIDNIPSSAIAADVAKRIINIFREPIQVGRHKLKLEISIGISIYPDSGITKDDLLNNAICALQSAKIIGGNIYIFYAKKLSNDAAQALEIEKSLRNAIVNDEFHLVYQPIVDVEKQRIETFEVLLRWHSKQLGVIDPDIFVQIAEKKGIMQDIGEWVFNKSIDQYAKWAKENPDIDLPSMSINCSVCHFKSKSFFSEILKKLKKHNISNKKIIIEITETMTFDDNSSIHSQVKDLDAKDIRIAIDDFGTGFSSLSHIKNIPVSTLKIDKSFITNVIFDNNDDAVVGSILHLGAKLAINVVAEGVETEEQAAYLKEKGCRLMQGFLFSKPLPTAEFIKYLREFSL